jgi:hypothetical protein
MLSSVFPWDAGLAIDGNPTTRWRSWQAVRPGMWIEARFKSPVAVDRVEAETSRDQTINLWIGEVQGARTMVPLSDDARRQATRAMAARGIRYLLIGDEYYAAADIRSNPARWGLALVVDRGSARLFRIL